MRAAPSRHRRHVCPRLYTRHRCVIVHRQGGLLQDGRITKQKGAYAVKHKRTSKHSYHSPVTCLTPPLKPLPRGRGGSWSRAAYSRSPLPSSSPSADHCDSLCHAGPSITDPAGPRPRFYPVVIGEGGSVGGFKINFNGDWRAVMQLPWLGRGQRGEIEGK